MPSSQEQLACKKSFKQNTIRVDDGKFVVTIPLQNSLNILGDSRQEAIKRFQLLERKFLSSGRNKSMDEFNTLGQVFPIFFNLIDYTFLSGTLL